MSISRTPVAGTVLLIVVATVLLVSCSSGDAPAAAAREWYIAINTMEALEADGLVCQAKREEFRREMETGSTLLIFGQLLLGDNIKIELDTSDVEFISVEEEEERAIVEAKGEMRAAVAGSVSSEILDERWLVVEEDGGWKWCGEVPTEWKTFDDIGQGRLIFSYNTDKPDSDIWARNVDGSGTSALTYSSTDPEDMATYSSDGSLIAYSVVWAEEAYIHVMNADGSEQKRLTTTSTDWYPAWSPDSSKLAFVSRRDGNSEIYMMNVDGTKQTRITNHPASDLFPSWSPDGTEIVFASDRGGAVDLYSIDLETSELRRLTKTEYVEWDPELSPDGQKIVFESERDGDAEIYIVNIDGSDLRQLTNNSFQDREPTWAPNANQIAFVSERNGDYDVYIINIDGSAELRVADTSNSEHYPSWGR